MKTEKEVIESFVWDCTVGIGDSECTEPDVDCLRALTRILGHKLTNDNLKTLEVAWDRCLQAMGQP